MKNNHPHIPKDKQKVAQNSFKINVKMVNRMTLNTNGKKILNLIQCVQEVTQS